MEQAVLLKFTQ